MKTGLLFVSRFLLIGVVALEFSFIGKASNYEISKEDCAIKWSDPIRDSDTQYLYIVIDNGCPFAVQVNVRNGGVDYGKYVGGGEKGQKLQFGTYGGKIEQDYTVTVARASGS